MSKITYQTEETPFYKALQTEVEAYFATKNKEKIGNASLYIKGIIIFSLAVYLYIQLVFFTPMWWIALPLAAVFGVSLALIGMNVMHDGCHGSYSNNRFLNAIAGYTLNLLGSDAFFWKLKHNMSHHIYTNIETADDDIESNFLLRFTPSYPRNVLHKYQHFYAPILYSFAMLSWVWWTDFVRYFSTHIGAIAVNMKFKDHLIFWLSKVLHVLLFIGIPIYTLSVGGWLLGYFLVICTAGLTIAFVFLLAHLVEATSLETAPINGYKNIEHEWAVHQIRTTADFAPNNKILTWLLGGLNYQVEHHLFPKISHVHYPKLQPIVQRVCEQFGVEYHSYPSMTAAIASHIRFMKKMGRS